MDDEITQILGRWHCPTETIEAVHYSTHIVHGGYRYALRFLGGRHHLTEIRCHTQQSVLQIFDEAVLARKYNLHLWWLDYDPTPRRKRKVA